MISKPYIKLKNVSKVFGQNPDTVIDLVQNNIDKTELQNDYNHVTWYSSDQDFWNKSICRYTNSTFPLKQMKENIDNNKFHLLKHC